MALKIKSKPPAFKPVMIGSLEGIYSYCYSQRISKMIPTKESWRGCFNEIRDENNEFISGNVEINIYPEYRGIKYNELIHVEKFVYKISIWGNDDTYMTRMFDSYENALGTYDLLDSCPFMRTLHHVWGFGWD